LLSRYPPLSAQINWDIPEVSPPITIHEGLSLVTSFWAEEVVDITNVTGDHYRQSSSSNNPHRPEIEAAILANLQNPNLQQIAVILDSVNETTMNCQGFVDYMTYLSSKIYPNSSIVKDEENSTALPKLACIERYRLGQPTYFEMFHYATYHPLITSDKVIISNADQVFDESISYAQQMSNTTIFVLGSYGYDRKKIPKAIRNQYRAFIGKDSRYGTANRCKDGRMRDEWFRGYGDSWDTYIFHRSLLQGSLPKNVDHNGDRGPSNEDETFRRLNFQREPTVYYMNELAAEYVALYDVTKNLLGKVTVWNPCHVIRTWHFHLAEKMHRGGDKPKWPDHTSFFGGGYVFYDDFGPLIPEDLKTLDSPTTTMKANTPLSLIPPPYAFVPFCYDIETCFSKNQSGLTFFHSQPHQDASKFKKWMTNATLA